MNAAGRLIGAALAAAVWVAGSSAGALAAGPGTPAAAVAPRPGGDARYADERALCESGLSQQDRQACLKEAAAARAAARHGELEHLDAARYLDNALARCRPLPPDDRADCEARIRGSGTTRGSVEAGGIYRETVTREIEPPGDAPAPAPAQPR